jgi:chemotaxis signal transduction protein
MDLKRVQAKAVQAKLAQRDVPITAATEELAEYIEFYLGGQSVAVPVMAVTELMRYAPVPPVPRANPCVEGVYQPRDVVFTVIDLAKFFSLPPSEDAEKDILIITDGEARAAFHVHGVVGIFTPDTLGAPESLPSGVTAIAKFGDKIVSVVDLPFVATAISD